VRLADTVFAITASVTAPLPLLTVGLTAIQPASPAAVQGHPGPAVTVTGQVLASAAIERAAGETETTQPAATCITVTT
jgi:hypothetical protein